MPEFGQNLHDEMEPGIAPVALLLRAGWFSRLPDPMRSALLRVSRVRRYAAEQCLFSVGDPPGGLFGLETGCLAVETAQTDSPPQKCFLLHPGVWVGEGPVAGLSSRMVGLWATRPSTVLSIEIAAFRRVAAAFPELWRLTALLALENHGRTMGLAQDLMLRGSRERLTALLARLAGLREAIPPDQPMVDATQSEIAVIANLSRSVVSALLLAMEREGLLSLRRAGVAILDPERLLQQRGAAYRPSEA